MTGRIKEAGRPAAEGMHPMTTLTDPDNLWTPVSIAGPSSDHRCVGVALAAGGVEEILAARRRPPTLRAPRSTSFSGSISFPEGTSSCGARSPIQSADGAEVTLETINANDLQARLPPPSIRQRPRHHPDAPQLAASLSERPRDVSDLCERKARDQGGYYPESEAAAREGNRWPRPAVRDRRGLITYRKSWFARGGRPRAAEDARRVPPGGGGAEEEGPPHRSDLLATHSATPAWTYPLLWGFGGAETDTRGRGSSSIRGGRWSRQVDDGLLEGGL